MIGLFKSEVDDDLVNINVITSSGPGVIFVQLYEWSNTPYGSGSILNEGK